MGTRAPIALACALVSACAPDAIIAAIPRDAGPDVVFTDAPLVCPVGRGPAMANLVDYCIDLTEVTKAQYAAFLATAPAFTSHAPQCRWNVDFVPNGKATPLDSSCDETLHPDVNDATKFPSRPVVCVDWCDAAAYCAWPASDCAARGPARPTASSTIRATR